MDSLCAETQTCVSDTNEEITEEVFMRMNRKGVLIEGGEVFKVGEGQPQVCMGVKKVLSDSTAVGNLVVGSSLLKDVTVIAPINRLSAIKPGVVSKRDKMSLDSFSICSRRNNLVVAPFKVRLDIRRAILGKALLKEVQSALRLSSFKKNFSLGVLSPEFDYDVFNISNDNFEYSYLLGNLSGLDTLMGDFWDIQSPAGRCSYVTKITLKVKEFQLFGKVCCARCRQTLPKNYRSFLSKYDICQVGSEFDVEDEAQEL